MGRSTRLRVAWLLFVLAMLQLPGWASAQVVRGQSAVPTPQQLKPTPPGAAPARANDIFVAPEAGPCPLRDSNLSFVLKDVRFTGAEGIKTSHLLRSYDGLIGQKVPIWTVCDIRDRAAAALFSAGILARVEIPSQRIADGQLRLEVIAAHIASVHFHGDAGPAQAKVEGYIEHLRGLIPFDLNIAQRYLLLASEVPGVTISARIRPAEEGRGAVDLDIEAKRKLLDEAINVQNYGSRTLGPWAGLVRLDVNSLTGFGDRTSAVLYSTSDGVEQRVAQLIEEFRPGDQGLVVHASASYSQTQPGGSLAATKLKGDATDALFSLDYPLLRRQSEVVNLIAGFEYVNEKTDFASAGDAPLINDRLRVIFVRGEISGKGAALGRAWEAGADLELRKGLNILDASPIGEATLSHNGANPDAFVQRLDAHVSLHATPLVELYFGTSAQAADSALLTFEQLAVGNLTFGRGYDPSSVAGDRGIEGTTEVRVGPFNLAPKFSVKAYGFFDDAYVKYMDSTGGAANVKSVGGGLRLSYDNKYDLDIGYADPLNRINIVAAKPPPARLLVTLSARY